MLTGDPDTAVPPNPVGLLEEACFKTLYKNKKPDLYFRGADPRAGLLTATPDSCSKQRGSACRVKSWVPQVSFFQRCTVAQRDLWTIDVKPIWSSKRRIAQRVYPHEDGHSDNEVRVRVSNDAED